MSPDGRESVWLEVAREAMRVESGAIASAAERMDGSLVEAVKLIAGHGGNLVVMGVGKSGHVARKIAATLCSIGIRAVFLHPVEALHGDLGIYAPGDPTLFVSKSGSTGELLRIAHSLRSLPSPLIGILGNPAGPLAAEMDVVLDASVRRESDPDSLLPTASSMVALSVGHALAIALMQARGFTAERFGELHPAGQLARNLNLTVAEAMHGCGEVGSAAEDTPVKQVVIAMTRFPLGAACVVSQDGALLGLITDGDLRRALEAHDDIRSLRASDVMTRDPATISPEARLLEALRRMEDRPSQISVLPVVDGAGKWLGLVRLHDIYRVERASG
ncbi:MAG: KpsF/GutQ family sugar-phosphate isomerase [Acidobacteriota bacterium]|nr:KpsF/GutQ family sugar-phosphate isomerase [Acidobacteriota bacterium]